MIRKPSHRCHRRIRFWSGDAVFAKGMSKSAVYLALGRPDRVRARGSGAGVPFETWIYTDHAEAKSCQATIRPSTDWDIISTVRRFTGYRGPYGYYPFGPSVWG